MSRPIEYTPEVMNEIIENLDKYVSNTEVPIFAEFCYENDYSREYLYDLAKNNKQLSYAIKNCITKKEAQLERLALQKNVDVTMAIFSLKQLGWRDKQDVEHSGKVDSQVQVIKLTEVKGSGD